MSASVRLSASPESPPTYRDSSRSYNLSRATDEEYAQRTRARDIANLQNRAAMLGLMLVETPT
jgi:hypothetical protein